MSLTATQRETLDRLLLALREDELTSRQTAELERLVLSDEEAMRHYLRVANLSVGLRWMTEADGGQRAADSAEGAGFAVPGLDSEDQQSAIKDQQYPAPPIILDLSTTVDRSPLVNLFSPSGFLFPYAASALIVGIGLLIGWTCKVSLRQSVAPDRLEQVAIAVPSEQPSVGRITGLVACRWADPATKVVGGDCVALGRKLVLASGLVELSYDSGAKVILQGPVRYEVDSACGGFLSLGKLTARVEGRAEDRGRRAESKIFSPPSALRLPPSDRESPGERTANLTFSPVEEAPTTSLAPRPSSLFIVRTPTAVVTDLGTEFGVEVDPAGATISHVFQGKIEVCGVGQSSASAVQLGADESARVARGAKQAVSVIREAGPPVAFARRLHEPQPRVVEEVAEGFRGQPSYRLTDLGTLGGPESRAIGINAAGQVAGYSAAAGGGLHAFLYSDGAMTDLHAFSGPMSTAFAVNNRGQVVGDYLTGDGETCHAFLYSGGKMTDLGTLLGGDSFAHGLNDRGQVVGYSTDRKSGRSRAFLYSEGKMTDLGAPFGTDSYAHDINADGQVVGYCATAGKKADRAFLYRPGVGMKDLGTLGGSVSAALRINELGQIVGRSATAEAGDGVRMGLRAFVWAGGSGMKDLGSLGGYASSAFGINGKGQVVGDAIDSHGAVHAFLCQPDGTMIDLSAAVDPALRWTLGSARAINDRGQIAGYGRAPDGNTRAFLLTPLAKTRKPGATDVGAAIELPPQPQAEPAAIRGDRRGLPMN